MNFEAFYKISYGLYIISSSDGNKYNGYIANTAFQVTATPPQLAISCNTNNYTCKLIEKSKQFSVSILNQNAKAETIGLFGYKSGQSIKKFDSIVYTNAKSGTPVVIEDCIAWFDCKVNQIIDVGTHKLFIAEIVENILLDAEGKPLTYDYYRNVKKGVAPKNAPTYIEKDSNLGEVSEDTLTKYRCLACGYIYDPAIGDAENDIKPGTAFEDLPDDWICPTCGSPKEMFEAI